MSLVEHVVGRTIADNVAGSTVRVLDPACGDGRFLAAAARLIRNRGGVPLLTGVDIDLGGLDGADGLREPVEAIEADALAYDWGNRRFDVIVGNPPFLSQMATATVRQGGSRFGGGPYADAAADFLALSVRLARPDGGRVGLVLPGSLLTARDAGPIRAEVDRAAALRWFWWSPEPVFEALVRTCAMGFELGAAADSVACSTGRSFEPVGLRTPPASAANHHWGSLIAGALGVPELPTLSSAATLADYALVTANFRDQYYGLVGAVSDEATGPPLITTGLIDPARCHWGARPTRFAKQVFAAPRVDLSQLVPFMQRWATRCLVSKVLVATQTRVLEAVVDEHGEWLPAVPVIRLVPNLFGDVWSIAAVLTSPVASAVIAGQSAGSGLSAATVRVSQRTLGDLAWPAGDLATAVAAFRSGDLETCGRAVDAAYGVADADLFRWWQVGLSGRRR